MLARIILRNSTDKQAKAGTIRAQRAPVRELAQRFGADPLVEYVEEGVSGAAPLDERDVMLKLLAEARPGDLVCAFDLSRLTRADSLLQRYRVLGTLEAAGVRIATVDDGEIDLSTMGGRITMHVKGEIASDERRKFRMRTAAGKQNRAREGGKPQGATPYGWGYDKTTRQWSLVEPAASVRRELIDRSLRGETTNGIAKAMNAKGVAYPARKGSQTKWTAKRVWHFLTTPILKGEWTFDGTEIKVPALIDADTFARVQAQLSGNRERGRCRTKHVYLLDAGHGRCGLCGAPLFVQWGAFDGDTPYYVCQRRLREKACELPWWRTDLADGIVWGEVTKILEDPDRVEKALRSRASGTSADAKASAKDITSGERRLREIEDIRQMFVRLTAKGTMKESELTRELDRLAREERLLQQTVATAREMAERARAAVTEIGNIRAWLATVKKEVAKADAAERRRICRALAPTVEVGETKIKIGFKLRKPTGNRAALVGSTCCLTENQCETRDDLRVTVEKGMAAGL